MRHLGLRTEEGKDVRHLGLRTEVWKDVRHLGLRTAWKDVRQLGRRTEVWKDVRHLGIRTEVWNDVRHLGLRTRGGQRYFLWGCAFARILPLFLRPLALNCNDFKFASALSAIPL